MEIKLITTNATTSGGRVGFRFLGNVEIKKSPIITSPIIFGATVNPNKTVRFVVNGNTSGVTSNNESYFELYSDEPINSFKPYFAEGDGSKPEIDGSLLRTIDVTNLDTSQVTNMSNMFNYCTGLASLNVSNFDTSKVTNMSEMFGGCSGLTSLDVSHFNTSKVTDMSRMFKGCASLRTIKINDEASANKLKAQIKTDLNKTATWNSTTKEITIPA